MTYQFPVTAWRPRKKSPGSATPLNQGEFLATIAEALAPTRRRRPTPRTTGEMLEQLEPQAREILEMAGGAERVARFRTFTAYRRFREKLADFRTKAAYRYPLHQRPQPQRDARPRPLSDVDAVGRIRQFHAGDDDLDDGDRRRASVARRLGREDKAQRYLRWLEKELRIAEAEGIFPDDRLLAMYWAYKGRKEIAAEYPISSVRTRGFWSQAHQMVLLDDLTDQPAYLHAVKARQAELALQEAEVLEMLCGPEPVSRKYKPLPETCVQWQQAT